MATGTTYFCAPRAVLYNCSHDGHKSVCSEPDTFCLLLTAAAPPACSCLLLPAAACCWLLLPAAGCCCLLLPATASCGLLLPAAACYCLLLPAAACCCLCAHGRSAL